MLDQQGKQIGLGEKNKDKGKNLYFWETGWGNNMIHLHYNTPGWVRYLKICNFSRWRTWRMRTDGRSASISSMTGSPSRGRSTLHFIGNFIVPGGPTIGQMNCTKYVQDIHRRINQFCTAKFSESSYWVIRIHGWNGLI